jgi:hypothetical protein
MSETGGAQPGSVPPAKTSLAQKIVVGLIVLALAGCLGGAVFWVRTTDPQSAEVGDCVAQGSGDSISVVECGDADADFTVVGRLENKTQIEAGLFACSDFESATSSYWEGEQGEKGIVLCLAKKK